MKVELFERKEGEEFTEEMRGEFEKRAEGGSIGLCWGFAS